MYETGKHNLLEPKCVGRAIFLPEDEYRGIGRRLRRARELAGYSQEDVAKFLNVTGATYSRYESGQHKIAVADLYRLAEFLHVSPEYLVRGRQPSPGDLPDFDMYIRRKFEGNKARQNALIPSMACSIAGRRASAICAAQVRITTPSSSR